MTMRITNTIGWRTPWLERVIRFCCRTLDYPAERIAAAAFSPTEDSSYAARAYLRRHEITVKINPRNSYPFRMPRQRGLPDLFVADALDLLIDLTAHEIAHLERWDRFVRRLKESGGRDSNCEHDTERLARVVVEAFRHDRKRLLAAWGIAGPGPAGSCAPLWSGPASARTGTLARAVRRWSL
jgi:hypothetical protein